MPEQTVYDCIGGDAAIRAVVEEFYARLLNDATLAPFFGNLPAERVERLKGHQVAFLTQALGGPENYVGLPIAEAHARLGIDQQHFNTVAGHLIAVLRGRNVSEDLVVAIAERLIPLAREIVKD